MNVFGYILMQKEGRLREWEHKEIFILKHGKTRTITKTVFSGLKCLSLTPRFQI